MEKITFMPIFLAIELFCFKNSIAQQSTINLVVSIHNSETFSGKRKYVRGAEIKDDFKRATDGTTDIFGRFSLKYVGVANGKTVSFQVNKKGLQVINFTSLTAIIGQVDTIKISMSHPDSIVTFRERIYRVGKTESELRLRSLVKQNEEKILTLSKDAQKNKFEIERLKIQIEDWEAKWSLIENQAMELARKYSPINLDDASPIFRSSFILFQNGNIDSALSLLRTIDFEHSLKDINLEDERINTVRREIDYADSISKKRRQELGEYTMFKADLHKTKFEFDSTLKCYDQLLQLDSNNYDYNNEYAQFLILLNFNERAIDCQRRIIKISESISDSILRKYRIAISEAAVASNFKALSKVDSAIVHDSISLHMFFKLRDSKSNFLYPREVAGIMNDLSTIYWQRGEVKNAEKSFLNAYSIIEAITEEGNINHESVLAGISNNIGNFYKSIEDTSKAKFYYSKAIDIYRKYKNQPEIINRDLVNTLNNLSGLYMEVDSIKAEKYLFEALQICTEESKNDKRLFILERSMLHANLGRLYNIGNNFKKAEYHYMQQIEAVEPLRKNNPTVFQVEMADISMRLGMLYKSFNLDSASMMWLNLSLDLYTQHCTREKCIYEKERALLLSLIGGLYFKNHEIVKSLYYHSLSYESYNMLFQLSPDVYGKDRDKELQQIMNVALVTTVVQGVFKIITGITLPPPSLKVNERHRK